MAWRWSLVTWLLPLFMHCGTQQCVLGTFLSSHYYTIVYQSLKNKICVADSLALFMTINLCGAPSTGGCLARFHIEVHKTRPYQCSISARERQRSQGLVWRSSGSPTKLPPPYQWVDAAETPQNTSATDCMKYIARGSKNQNYSKLTLEQSCRNERDISTTRVRTKVESKIQEHLWRGNSTFQEHFWSYVGAVISLI